MGQSLSLPAQAKHPLSSLDLTVANEPCFFLTSQVVSHRAHLKTPADTYYTLDIQRFYFNKFFSRQGNGECRPPVAILYSNGTAMQFDDSFSDRQAQSRAAEGLGTGFFNSKKLFEQSW